MPYEVDVADDGKTIHVRYLYGLVRTIHVNGTSATENIPLSVEGYSWGQWQGDMLVIKTARMSENIWFPSGYPISPQAILTERYWPGPPSQTILFDLTIEDPAYYNTPFLATRREYSIDQNAALELTPCEPLPF